MAARELDAPTGVLDSKSRSSRSKGTGVLGDITNLEGKNHLVEKPVVQEVRRSKVCGFLICRVPVIFLFEWPSISSYNSCFQENLSCESILLERVSVNS